MIKNRAECLEDKSTFLLNMADSVSGNHCCPSEGCPCCHPLRVTIKYPQNVIILSDYESVPPIEFYRCSSPDGVSGEKVKIRKPNIISHWMMSGLAMAVEQAVEKAIKGTARRFSVVVVGMKNKVTSVLKKMKSILSGNAPSGF